MEPSDQHLQLRLEGLKKVFKSDVRKNGQVAVNDLTLDFPAGKCTGLLGHNGAGKTTTIKLILGLIKADKGKVLVNGKTIRPMDIGQMGYLPEITSLSTLLTAKEALNTHLSIFQPDFLKETPLEEVVDATLEKVGLADASGKLIAKYSKGMGRRLSWALATIHAPKLLILDEPFTGLDPLGRQDLLHWIKQARDDGKTIILCSHDLHIVSELCDHFHILRGGRLAYSTCSAGTKSSVGDKEANIFSPEILALFSGEGKDARDLGR